MPTQLSDEARAKINREYPVVIRELRELLISAVAVDSKFKNATAAKYWKYGLGRRLNRVTLCLERFHRTFYKDLAKEAVTDAERFEQTAFLNLCLIDVSGGLDNLARVLLLEKDVVLPDRQIALHKSETKKHLPEALLALTEKFSNWMKYLQDFRDPLAHRISPYVLPHLAYTSGGRSHDSYYTADFEDSGMLLLHPQMLVDARTFAEFIKVTILSLENLWLYHEKAREP